MMKRINWLFLIAGTLVMIYVMASTGRTLKTPATPLGILDLEFAYNKTMTQKVIHAWTLTGSEDGNNIRVAIKNTWLDFIFIFFYSLFLFYTCKTMSEAFTGPVKKAGMLFAIGALYAGMLDIVENGGMLVTLNGFLNGGVSMFTATCATLKWILVVLALLYILLTWPVLLYRLIKEK